MNKSMKISPNFKVDDFMRLGNLKTEEDWMKAIDIFRDRINGSFLKFIDCIQKSEYAGFVVMAIDCLLIETLMQFYKGKEETPSRNLQDYFVKFLTSSSFKEYFTKETAIMFYKQIRCGILHQAEVKKDSRINIGIKYPLVQHTNDGEGLIINRKLFHKKLVEEFNLYTSCLKDSKEKELRQNFIKKMRYICRIPFNS